MDQYPVLHTLLGNNVKWSTAIKEADPNYFPSSAGNPQRPKVLWIGCSDSRVPENTLFAAMPGEIFSTRNIANQVHLHDDSLISVITYALSKSVGVEHIIIAGHTACGGAKACLLAARDAIAVNPSDPTAAIPCGTPLERWLAPLTKHAVTLLQEHKIAWPSPDEVLDFESESRTLDCEGPGLTDNELSVENVRLGVESVLKSDPVREAWKRSGSSLKAVHGVMYHLSKGIVEDLKMTVTRPHRADSQ